MSKPIAFNYQNYEQLKEWADSIVRCKDCKHWSEKGHGYREPWECSHWAAQVEPNDFCSYGEEGEA